MSKSILNGLSGLKELRMSFNRLSSVDSTTFKELLQVIDIQLSSNRIVAINRNALIGLNDLEAVYLDDNPIAIYLQDRLNDICSNNSKCKVYF